MDKQRKDELLSFLLSMTVVAVSLYPLYRDELARWRLKVTEWFTCHDQDAEALKQVQREISLLEHGAE